ncbi:MAG: transcriptional regulator NrdR [Chloroflexi bacterium]|nr:transcriptional regulator NrdR [Chloroflexota bacterium]MDA1147470.1 transcriptional regulator NrdR [Chloroflexota bacterium]MQC83037.1 transcriptional repressor NrdR [Chloroflexota bacterium]
MNCPFCGKDASSETTVVETREAVAGVYRQRRCASCDEPFTTVEQVQPTVIMVVKKDGRREEFQRQKLLTSLRIAARKRPLPEGALEAIVEDIERRVMGYRHGEVGSRILSEMVITRLKALDPIAYIRFASIYHQFVSLEQMLEELERIALAPDVPAPEQARMFDDGPLGLGSTGVGADGVAARNSTPIDLAAHRGVATR